MAAPIIDWKFAEWIAARIAGDSPQDVRIDLAALAEDAQQRVIDYTGLVPQGPLPAAEAVTRTEWVRSNISSSRATLDPLIAQMTGTLPAKNRISLPASALASAEIGVLIGYLGSRVLGQYELVLLDEHADGHQPRLLMVMPNLARAVERFDADPVEFFTWVTLHEVTHAVQFGSVPWLREHLAALLRRMVAGAQARLGGANGRLQIPDRAALARVARAARAGDLIGMFASDAEREVFDSTQAVMAVIEGHAEHVMDAVAPELLPSLPDLRAKMSSRRRQQKLAGRLISRGLGMEMKMRQYEHGKAFCDVVAAEGGPDALLYLFSSPAALPSSRELLAPASWLTRIKPAL